MRRMMRGTNPMMRYVEGASTMQSAYPATLASFTMKLLMLGAVLFLSASFSYINFINEGVIVGGGAMIFIAPIGAFISLIVAMRKPDLAPIFAFIYALLQGVFIGLISGVYELSFGDGIVFTALVSTLGVFLSMSLLYRSGLVKVTDRFRRVLYTALVGLLITSLVLVVMSLLGAINFINLGFLLLISAVSTVVASLYLLIDLDNISNLISSGADRQFEWIFALSLMVTLVWLYVELLRLIAILSRRRN
jgi:uncharacterized YccA/Bax inhibitor family protein